MKKAVFLVLALALLFSLAACGSPAPVVGTWQGPIYIKQDLVAEAPELDAYLDSALIQVDLELSSRGSYTYSFSGSGIADEMRAAVRAYFEDVAASNGMSVSDLEEAMGSSLDDFLDEVLAEADFGSLDDEGGGFYKYSDGTLIMDPNTEDELSGRYDSGSDVILLPIQDYGEVTLYRK